MLSKKAFLDGISMLVAEYAEKGFNMNKERSKQWYDFCTEADMTDYEFIQRVKNVLMHCTYSPSMAELFTEKNHNGGSYTVPKRSPEDLKRVYVVRNSFPTAINMYQLGSEEVYYETFEECVSNIKK